MKKKILFILLRICLVIAFTWVICMFASNYLDEQIETLYNNYQLTVDTTHAIDPKDKGTTLLQTTFNNEKGMIVMGSSELSSKVPENPKYILPNQDYTSHVTYVGRASFQNALQGMLLGTNSESIKGNDVVIVESLQWYFGVNTDAFLSNFSEYSFYNFLQNDNISDSNKQYLCRRFMELQNSKVSNISDKYEIMPNVYTTNIDYPQSYLLAQSYLSDSIIGKTCYYLLKPYYFIRNDVLSLKEKFTTYKYLLSIEGEATPTVIHDIDWDATYAQAQIEGETACTNNDIYVEDEYYTTYLADKYESLKDSSSSIDLMNTDEWGDYKFFLSVCNDLDIKPYVVVMSTNGRYYDYIGITKEKRDEYYENVEKLANDAGYDFLDLSDKEYEPYFYFDVMHLGWRGWTYVTEHICNYYGK